MSVVRSLNIAHEATPEEALAWFQRSIFSDIPPYFMTHWKTGKKFFYAGDALLAYEETPQHLIVAGEPLVAAGSDDDEIKQAFSLFSKRKKKSVCGYYVGKSWSWARFFKIPLGTSTRIPLQEFDLKSPEAREVRRALRKGKKLNYRAVPVQNKKEFEFSELKLLYRKWHKTKLPFQMHFFLSKPKNGQFTDPYEEWFVVECEGQILAFCSLLPYLKGGELGFYVDHLIYDPKRDPHALSFLISFLIEVFKGEGVSELNLGLNPFAHVDQSSLMSRLFGILYHVPFFYRPKGLHFFKTKFTGVEEKEYCFFQSRRNKWFGLIDMAWVTLVSPKKLTNRMRS